MPAQNGGLLIRMTRLLPRVAALNSEKCASGRVATLSSNCAAAFNPTPVKINTHVTRLIGAPPAPDWRSEQPDATAHRAPSSLRTCFSPSLQTLGRAATNAEEIRPHRSPRHWTHGVIHSPVRHDTPPE